VNEAIEDGRAFLRRKFSAMERHIDDLRLIALNNNDCAVVEVESRLAALESSTSGQGAGRKARAQTRATSVTMTKSTRGQKALRRRRAAFRRIDSCAEQAERFAAELLQRLSRHVDEAECAVVRAMLMRMDAEAALGCDQSHGSH
jgi:hypothetical protein